MFLFSFFNINAKADINPDQLHIAIPLEPPHLDPTSTAAEATAEVTLNNIYEGLVEIDRNGHVKPLLAKSWKVSRDGKLYIFNLVKNVIFHDGTPFAADDVRFSLMRAKAEESLNARNDIFKRIKDVRIVSDYEIEVELHEAFGEFLFYLGTADAVMVSHNSSKTNNNIPIGTGPYIFSKWAKGHHIELIANSKYWRGEPKIKFVEFRFLSDPSIQMAHLLSGDIDLIPNMSSAESLPRIEKDDRFHIEIGSTEGETILAMNNDRGPLKDKKVRQAISHAINKQNVIDVATKGYARPIGSHFSPNHPAYIDLTGMYQYDIAKAKQLLKEAGYANGFNLTLRIPPISYAQRSSDVVAYQLGQIGIKVMIEAVDWSTWLTRVYRKRDYDLTIVAHTEPLDISNYGKPSYYYNHQNTDLKTLIQNIFSTPIEEERFKLYKTAQKLIAEDAINVFLFQLPKIGVWHKRLQGPWQNSPLQKHPVFEMYWAY